MPWYIDPKTSETYFLDAQGYEYSLSDSSGQRVDVERSKFAYGGGFYAAANEPGHVASGPGAGAPISRTKGSRTGLKSVYIDGQLGGQSTAPGDSVVSAPTSRGPTVNPETDPTYLGAARTTNPWDPRNTRRGVQGSDVGR